MQGEPGRAAATAGVHVRKAGEHDLASVQAIERASFSDPWSLEGFRDTMEQPHAHLEVAVGPDDTILGYAVAWCVSDESEIANLAVAPGARRRGIGLLLLDRILQAAATFGARTVFLEVRESNVAAQELYGARGFEVAGRRKQYYTRPREDALVMRRTL